MFYDNVPLHVVILDLLFGVHHSVAGLSKVSGRVFATIGQLVPALGPAKPEQVAQIEVMRFIDLGAEMGTSWV